MRCLHEDHVAMVMLGPADSALPLSLPALLYHLFLFMSSWYTDILLQEARGMYLTFVMSLRERGWECLTSNTQSSGSG